jgi:mRNA interferase RelE/StbE
MQYRVSMKRDAIKSLASLTLPDRQRINAAILKLQDGLAGDVKKLRNFTPRYRLRVGDYRVLFEVEKDEIIIHVIGHRRETYR